jgi:hypothetical protein
VLFKVESISVESVVYEAEGAEEGAGAWTVTVCASRLNRTLCADIRGK